MLVWTQWYGYSSLACILPLSFLTFPLLPSPFPCHVWLPVASMATRQAWGTKASSPIQWQVGMGSLQPHLNSRSSLVLLLNLFNPVFPIIKHNRMEVNVSAGFKLRTLGNITIFGEEIKCLIRKREDSFWTSWVWNWLYLIVYIPTKLGFSCWRWNPHCFKKAKSNLTRVIRAQI